MSCVKIVFEPDRWTYAIHRIGRIWEEGYSYEELKQRVKAYALPESMTEFDMRNFNPDKGYIKNVWREWAVLAYVPEEYWDNIWK